MPTIFRCILRSSEVSCGNTHDISLYPTVFWGFPRKAPGGPREERGHTGTHDHHFIPTEIREFPRQSPRVSPVFRGLPRFPASISTGTHGHSLCPTVFLFSPPGIPTGTCSGPYLGNPIGTHTRSRCIPRSSGVCRGIPHGHPRSTAGFCAVSCGNPCWLIAYHLHWCPWSSVVFRGFAVLTSTEVPNGVPLYPTAFRGFLQEPSMASTVHYSSVEYFTSSLNK